MNVRSRLSAAPEDADSVAGTITRDADTRAQTNLDDYISGLAERARDTGAQAAMRADVDWTAAAFAVIDEYSSTGLEFTSEDVRMIVGPPTSPSAMGAVFGQRARQGRILRVGDRPARRHQRRHGRLAVWIGAT